MSVRQNLIALLATAAAIAVLVWGFHIGLLPNFIPKVLDWHAMQLRERPDEAGVSLVHLGAIALAALTLLIALPLLLMQLLDSSKDLDGVSRPTQGTNNCSCRACLRDQRDENGIPKLLSTFVVCTQCGNKRCPKAQNHLNICTKSNAPNQPHLHQ